MYQKFSADNLFTGNKILQNRVLITDAKGMIENIVSPQDAGDDIQYIKGIISPGFINCHCHLELSHMRGLIPEKTGLIDFVFSVVTKRHFDEEEILQAIATAENEMLQNGIVAVGDICNNGLTALQKSKQRLHYYNFVEASGWLPQIADARMSRSLEVYNTYCQLLTPNPQAPVDCQLSSIVPHAPYSVSENLWQLLQPYFQGKTVSIHNQETSFEDELFIQGSGDFTRMYQLMKLDTSFFSPSGKSSLQTYFPKLKGAQNVLLVHNTFTKKNDVLYAKDQATLNNQQLFFCLCVNANLYIENALPPLEMLINNDCTLVLGTDSIASNYSLSILDEMKTIKRHFNSVTTEQLLQMATLNGAKALNMSDKLGSFEKGKQPGVIVISEDFNSVRRLL
jgi:cytosine/adenosine deaminase-related metal-dependent hydrolase